MQIRKLKLLFYVPLLSVLALTTPACSTFGTRYQEIRVASQPSSAQVFLDGELKGATPVNFTLRRNQEHLLEVRKAGYLTEFRALDSSTPSTLGLLDMIGGVGLLVPFFGLLSDAAWEYEPSVFGLHLRPAESERSPEATAQ